MSRNPIYISAEPRHFDTWQEAARIGGWKTLDLSGRPGPIDPLVTPSTASEESR